MARAKKVVKKLTKAEKIIKEKRSRSGKNANRKGKAFEREVATLMGHIFSEAKRHLEFQADEAAEGVDLSNTDIFKFQCKNHQNYCSISTIFEVKLTSPDDIPVLLTKGNKLETMAVLPFRDFLRMLAICYGIDDPFVSKEQRKLLPAAQVIKGLPPFATKDIEELSELHDLV